MSRRRIVVAALLLIGCVALAHGAYTLSKLAPIGAGYTAKTLCSGVFVSGRAPQEVLEQDVRADSHPLLRLVSAEVDVPRQRVRARFVVFAERVAQYRPGLGCTLALGTDADTLARGAGAALPAAPSAPIPPVAEPLPALQAAVDWAFDADPAAGTRAVVVLRDGRLAAQRYAPGFTADTPLPGWSMSKTLTAALAGVLVAERRLALDSSALLPEWRTPGDPRARITLDQLLRMTDGLAFSERYQDPMSDVVVMLFGTGDSSGYAAAKPLEHAPGTHWRYSSGASNALMRALRAASGRDARTFRAFARSALFERIGMTRSLFEPDASGMPVASSYVYASPHDWARFGQLLLQDGVWTGQRILPPGWVRYMAQLTPQSAARGFGAHVWLRVPQPYHSRSASPPTLPPDAYHLAGHEGQLLSVVPSRRLVLLRLGLTREPAVWDHEAFLARVVDALDQPPAGHNSSR